MPGGDLRSGRAQKICKPRIFEWHFMPGLWIFYGVYAGVYGFSEREMVLSLSGMYDCGNRYGAYDRPGIGENISPASVELFRKKISGGRLYLSYGISGLGNAGLVSGKIYKSIFSCSNP